MITLYDTTLRDGTQQEGIHLTVQDKLRITDLLDEFGIHLIEGGWPGSNPKDAEYFKRARDIKLKHARIAAFGSTCRVGLNPADDDQIRLLLEAETPVVTIFGKSWTRHVHNVLRTELDENLRMIEESVAYLRRAGREVIFDAEHFFDGFADHPDYALACLRAAESGGAEAVVLCDTNGGKLPWEVETAVAAARGAVWGTLGIHTHNDSGCAVANSLAAIRAGVTHVQGTMNGIGERCGNADLCTLIADIELKLDERVLPDGKLVKLADTAHVISEIANMAQNHTAPYVGRSAFAHKAGVHASAVQRDEGSYEHIDPAIVGAERRVLVSELAGRSNLFYKASEFGFADADDHNTRELLSRIKELENKGFAFEAAEASIELMMRREQADYQFLFELIDFMVVVEHREGRGHIAEANVKIRIGEQIFHTASDGVGPVGALDTAMRKALIEVYPQIEQFRLADYKVRILDGNSATAATTRVLIDTTDGEATWTTVGASRNIIEASWRALYDSIEYGLRRAADRKAAEEAATEAA
jgi:2-isopropylmalate synthase